VKELASLARRDVMLRKNSRGDGRKVVVMMVVGVAYICVDSHGDGTSLQMESVCCGRGIEEAKPETLAMSMSMMFQKTDTVN
jgi:hypothetical protein